MTVPRKVMQVSNTGHIIIRLRLVSIWSPCFSRMLNHSSYSMRLSRQSRSHIGASLRLMSISRWKTWEPSFLTDSVALTSTSHKMDRTASNRLAPSIPGISKTCTSTTTSEISRAPTPFVSKKASWWTIHPGIPYVEAGKTTGTWAIRCQQSII